LLHLFAQHASNTQKLKTSEMTVSQDDRPAGAPAVTPSSTPRHEEYQYLDLVREILEEGELRQDR
jgi:thymidylate synthase